MKYILCIMLVCSLQQVKASDSAYLKWNAIYGELFGNGDFLFSINYERTLLMHKHSKFRMAIRAGACIGTNLIDEKAVYTFPTEILLLYGTKKHFLEAGGGFTPIFGSTNLNDTIPPGTPKSYYDYCYFLRLGYRLIFNDGVILRFAPLVTFSTDLPMSNKLLCRLSFGLSLGSVF